MWHIIGCILLGIVSLLHISAEAASQERVLRLIVVRSRAEAQDLLQQVKQGASFSALAYKHSIGPERSQGGYSGVILLDDMQEELRQALRGLKDGQVSKVINIGTRYILIKPISLRIPKHYQQAEQAWKERKVAQAVKALQAALALEKDSVQTQILLGIAYGKAKDFQKAFKQLEKAQHAVPDLVRLTILRATLYTDAAIQKGKSAYAKRALKIYREALRKHEKLAPVVHFGLGRVHLVALKQPEKAIPHFKQAVEKAPNYREAYGLLIQAYYDAKRYNQAWRQLRAAEGMGYRFPKLLAALHEVKKQAPR